MVSLSSIFIFFLSKYRRLFLNLKKYFTKIYCLAIFGNYHKIFLEQPLPSSPSNEEDSVNCRGRSRYRGNYLQQNVLRLVMYLYIYIYWLKYHIMSVMCFDYLLHHIRYLCTVKYVQSLSFYRIHKLQFLFELIQYVLGFFQEFCI